MTGTDSSGLRGAAAALTGLVLSGGVGLVAAAASWMSLGWREHESGFRFQALRYDMYDNGLWWQFVDILTVVICGFILFSRVTWLLTGWTGRLFRIRLPFDRLAKLDFILLGLSGLLLLNAFRLANEGFPPW